VCAESAAEHSYYVAVIGYTLSTISTAVFEKPWCGNEVVRAALFHDAAEAITGDVILVVKEASPEVATALVELERSVLTDLVSGLPSCLRPMFAPDVQHEWSPEVTRLVKAADILDCYLKAQSELALGNGDFQTVLESARRRLSALAVQEAEWFLDHFATHPASSSRFGDQTHPGGNV
jgi:5'-deoxynucleotidase